MKEKPYHHGNLQTELIEEGLALIHEEGKGNFSLRKLAKRLGPDARDEKLCHKEIL